VPAGLNNKDFFQILTLGRSIWYTADFAGFPTYKAFRRFIIATLQLWVV